MKTLRMEDHGTRLQHLMELHELWSNGLAIATQGYQTLTDKARAAELQIALKLLCYHLEKDYDCGVYGMVVNSLPKNPEEIINHDRENPST